MIDLEVIKARLAAATPGPWKLSGSGFVCAGSLVLFGGRECHPWPENFQLIAHAPTDIAALLAEIDRRGEALRHLRDLIDAGDGIERYCDARSPEDCDHCVAMQIISEAIDG